MVSSRKVDFKVLRMAIWFIKYFYEKRENGECNFRILLQFSSSSSRLTFSSSSDVPAFKILNFKSLVKQKRTKNVENERPSLLLCEFTSLGETITSGSAELVIQRRLWIHIPVSEFRDGGSVNSDILSLFWISALTETIRHTTRYVQELSLMFAKDLSVQMKFLSVQIL